VRDPGVAGDYHSPCMENGNDQSKMRECDCDTVLGSHHVQEIFQGGEGRKVPSLLEACVNVESGTAVVEFKAQSGMHQYEVHNAHLLFPGTEERRGRPAWLAVQLLLPAVHWPC